MTRIDTDPKWSEVPIHVDATVEDDHLMLDFQQEPTRPDADEIQVAGQVIRLGRVELRYSLAFDEAGMRALREVTDEGLVAVTEPRECMCERCARPYEGWFAPNALWNEVVGGYGEGVTEPPEWQFLCTDCFTTLAVSRIRDRRPWFVVSEEVEGDPAMIAATLSDAVYVLGRCVPRVPLAQREMVQRMFERGMAVLHPKGGSDASG